MLATRSVSAVPEPHACQPDTTGGRDSQRWWWVADNLLELAQEAEIEKLETKAKGVQKWCDDVSLTASTQDYQAKAVELKKLMRKLGVG